MSTRKTPQRRTCCRLDPAAFRMFSTLARHCPAKGPYQYGPLACCPTASGWHEFLDCGDPDGAGRLRRLVRFHWRPKRNDSLDPVASAVEVESVVSGNWQHLLQTETFHSPGSDTSPELVANAWLAPTTTNYRWPDTVTATIGSSPCHVERSVRLRKCIERSGWCSKLKPDPGSYENWWSIAFAAWWVTLALAVASWADSGLLSLLGTFSTPISAAISSAASALATWLGPEPASKLVAIASWIVTALSAVSSVLGPASFGVGWLGFLVALVATAVFLFHFVVWLHCCAPRQWLCRVLADLWWAMLWADRFVAIICFVLGPGG